MTPPAAAVADWRRAEPADAPMVVLSLASTPVEREVVAGFAGELTLAEDAGRALALAAETGARIAPVGGAGLPRERGGDRRFARLDLRLGGDPSRPGARAQAKLLERAPERVRV